MVKQDKHTQIQREAPRGRGEGEKQEALLCCASHFRVVAVLRNPQEPMGKKEKRQEEVSIRHRFQRLRLSPVLLEL